MTEPTQPTNFTFVQKTLAIGVHFFTSLGIVTGFLALLAIRDHDWQMAMGWLLVGLIIDGVDGTFARIFRVKEVWPNFDGKSIDYVIDFANYAFIPAYFFYEAQLVPASVLMLSTVAILLVSAVYYGKTGMVSDDYHFMGFPVLWNMVVFYLFFVLKLPGWVNAVLVLILCILHFVPIKYVYPSRSINFKWLNIGNTVAFFVVNILIVYLYPTIHWELNAISIASVAVFFGVGLWNTFKK